MLHLDLVLRPAQQGHLEVELLEDQRHNQLRHQLELMEELQLLASLQVEVHQMAMEGLEEFYHSRQGVV